MPVLSVQKDVEPAKDAGILKDERERGRERAFLCKASLKDTVPSLLKSYFCAFNFRASRE